MPVANPVVLVLLYHEVVVHVALRGSFQRAKNRAPVIFASLRSDQSLRIDVENSSAIRFWSFNDFDAETLCLIHFVLWDDNCTKRQLSHPVCVVVLVL